MSSETRKREKVAGARLTLPEYVKLKAHAKKAGMSVSEFVRNLILEAIHVGRK
jgi:hypothetical protein